MKAFSGYNDVKVFTEQQKIVPGGYIAIIKDAYEIENQNGGKRIEICFDIAEGDFKDYYADQYRSNPNADKRWRGKVSIFEPRDDGSDDDIKTKRRFKTAIQAIEDSNNGYAWNWDEKSLKGKKCGVVLQDKEWEFNGNTGWTAVPYSICSVEAIRNNTFYMPKPKELQNKSVGYASYKPYKPDFEEVGADESDLPF